MMKKVWMLITLVALSLNPLTVQAGSKVHRPSLSDNEISILHLDLIRDHFEASGSKHSFFSSGSSLNDVLLQDLELFLSQYRNLPIAADALFLKGRILLKQGEEEAAAIAWLQVLYEHPRSEAAIGAKQRLLILLEKDWDDHASKVHEIINHKAAGTTAKRLISLIEQLQKIEDKHLAKALTKLQIEFLRRYPKHPNTDEVQILLAHNVTLESEKSGAFAFEKLLVLYPNSPYRPEALLATADIQRKDLKQYERAMENYKKLIHEYPKHALVKYAYQNLALILEDKMDRYPEAIENLEMIVKLFPSDKAALEALQTIAKLQSKELKQYREAVTTLRKLARLFRTDKKDALDALDDAQKLALKKLDDKALYAEILKQTFTDFPNTDAAPEAMYDLAEFTDEKLHQMKEAQNIYIQLIEKYPGHKYAKKARKKLY